MTERAHIFQFDRTTANGTVLDGLDDICLDDRLMSYLGARVQCPACNSIGFIEPDGERADDDLTGRKPALDGDFCACRCNPTPRVKASQDEWTVDA